VISRLRPRSILAMALSGNVAVGGDRRVVPISRYVPCFKTKRDLSLWHIWVGVGSVIDLPIEEGAL